MKTSDFTFQLTSTQLKENINKQFGVKINLERYEREQLEDMRNKLRTRIFQHEGSAGINDLLTNETYQKDKAMLELLNTRIKEMLGENIKKLKEQLTELTEAKKGVRRPKFTKKTKKSSGSMSAKDYDGDGKIESPKDEVWGSRAKAAKKSGKPFKEAAKDKSCPKCGESVHEGSCSTEVVAEKAVSKAQQKFMGMVHATKKGKKPASKEVAKAAKGMSAKDAEDFAATKHKGLPEKKKKMKESLLTYRKNVHIVNENLQRLINEDEEEKAQVITSAGDMANDFTNWMQRVGQYQTKVMIELSDEIRHNFGMAEAEAFKQAIGPALTATLETLTTQREVISNAVATLAGGEPMPPMGSEPTPDLGMDMNSEPGPELSSPDMMNEPGDEFAASDAAAGIGAPGREMRESSFHSRLAESHSIISKLAK
jgi:hypothetical protein